MLTNLTATPAESCPASVIPTVVLGAVALLRQCAGFVGAISDEAYIGESATIRGGTIGKHVRHSLDHFAAAIGVLECPGVIDYDHRARNVPMETSRAAALERLAAIEESMGMLDASALEKVVRVRFMVSGDGVEAELTSTIGRELAFASHHAIHHHAMMKAMAAEFGVSTGAEFGRAPSTVQFDRGSGSCSRHGG